MGVFRSESEGRLRAGWRLLLFHVLLIALTVAVALAVGFVPALGAPIYAFAVLQVGVTVAWLGALVIAAGTFDRRPLRDYGLHVDRRWWTDLAFGLVLGAALMTGIFLVELALGWLAVTGALGTAGMGAGEPFLPALVSVIVIMVGVGVAEELWTRGYLIRNLAEGLSGPLGRRAAVVAALVVSSLVFAALHLLNPNATALAAINLALAGALLLGGGYALTGQLAIPIGVHVTWNLFQGGVFGLPVSGIPSFGASVLETSQAGPELWTGGAFGPEGGLLGTIAIVIGFVAIAGWVRYRHGHAAVDSSLARYEP